MIIDPWLSRWMPIILERASDGRVLEIGCGTGDDTAVLSAVGMKVHAFDVSTLAVEKTKTRVPSALVECRDIREPLPEQATDLGVIVASLSLHYFSWGETHTIVQRVRSALRSGGVLLCRLNSTEDHNFGASGNSEIEPDFFLVNGQPKRFFNKRSVESLFADGWNILSMEHLTTRKYVKQKMLWEVVLERSGA